MFDTARSQGKHERATQEGKVGAGRDGYEDVLPAANSALHQHGHIGLVSFHTQAIRKIF
ncbi:MAG: hypothetical protein ABI645_02840 [Pseudomonadota bacterium]